MNSETAASEMIAGSRTEFSYKMDAGHYDLPVIWRGCDWPPIIFLWLDANNQPFNLTNWTPIAHATDFDLNAAILNATAGTTQISLSRQQTSSLNLGRSRWDWLWKFNPSGVIFPSFFLTGDVTVKEPVTPPA